MRSCVTRAGSDSRGSLQSGHFEVTKLWGSPDTPAAGPSILMSVLEPAASCLQPSLACEEEMCNKMGPGGFLAPCPNCV